MSRTVIGIAGLIGAGKTTLAMHLVENHNFRRIRFAGPLKDMIRALGLTREQVDGGEKELPCDLLGGRSPREAMQTLGTEWGRRMVCDDLWIRAWQNSVAEVPPGIGIVADDLRFPNEVAAIRKFPGSLIIRVERMGPRRTENYAHPSELQTFPADVTLINDSDIGKMLRQMDGLISASPLLERTS